MRLENECLRVEFDDASGGFTSIFDKRMGHEYVTAPERAISWRAIVPEGELQCGHVDASNAETALQEDTASIRWSLQGIEAEAKFALEGHALMATLRIRNTGESAIEEVLFP